MRREEKRGVRREEGIRNEREWEMRGISGKKREKRTANS